MCRRSPKPMEPNRPKSEPARRGKIDTTRSAVRTRVARAQRECSGTPFDGESNTPYATIVARRHGAESAWRCDGSVLHAMLVRHHRHVRRRGTDRCELPVDQDGRTGRVAGRADDGKVVTAMHGTIRRCNRDARTLRMHRARGGGVRRWWRRCWWAGTSRAKAARVRRVCADESARCTGTETG